MARAAAPATGMIDNAHMREVRAGFGSRGAKPADMAIVEAELK